MVFLILKRGLSGPDKSSKKRKLGKKITIILLHIHAGDRQGDRDDLARFGKTVGVPDGPDDPPDARAEVPLDV